MAAPRTSARATAAARLVQHGRQRVDPHAGQERGRRAREYEFHPLRGVGRQGLGLGAFALRRLGHGLLDARLDLRDQGLHLGLGQQQFGLVLALRIGRGHAGPGHVEQTFLGRGLRQIRVFGHRRQPQRQAHPAAKQNHQLQHADRGKRSSHEKSPCRVCETV